MEKLLLERNFRVPSQVYIRESIIFKLLKPCPSKMEMFNLKNVLSKQRVTLFVALHLKTY
jgi:hypothetical protein